MRTGIRSSAGLIVILLLARPEALAQDEALKKAVQGGIDWLIRHQDAEGRWSAEGFSGRCPKKDRTDIACEGAGHAAHDAGVTGLALLALLASPLPRWTAAHTEAVKKGLAWLAARQDREGCFGDRSVHTFNYSHAVATKAMAEAFDVLRADEWKKCAAEAVRFCLASQNPYKAWRYGVKPGDNDTSVTAWMVGALAAAKRSGIEVPEDAFRWAAAFISEMTDEETGRTGYTRRGEFPVRPESVLASFPGTESEAMTGAGIHVRLLCGEDSKSSEPIRRGVALLLQKAPQWKVKEGRTDFISWHHGTLALAKLGGKSWTGWRKSLVAAVVPAQEKSGCRRGSWPPSDPWGGEGGRIYATSLLTLCLQVCAETPSVPGK